MRGGRQRDRRGHGNKHWNTTEVLKSGCLVYPAYIYILKQQSIILIYLKTDLTGTRHLHETEVWKT